MSGDSTQSPFCLQFTMPSVVHDAVTAFPLARVGGVLVAKAFQHSLFSETKFACVRDDRGDLALFGR